MRLLFSKNRRDGTWIRPAETYAVIMPYIFRTRTESLVYYPTEIDVAPLREYVRKKRAEGLDVSMFNLVVAAFVRTANDLPKINRFIVGRRMYQRNHIAVSYTVKRSLEIEAPETSVCQRFEAADTVADVHRRMKEQIDNAKDGVDNAEGRTISIMQRLPRPLLRALVALVRTMEYFDILPKALMESMPFYCSFFVSNLASIGLNAPFHHLYELGTCPVFVTLGRINTVNELQSDGTVEKKQMMQLKVTVDERIVDGFYFSCAMRHFAQLMAHPELMDEPPEKVNV